MGDKITKLSFVFCGSGTDSILVEKYFYCIFWYFYIILYESFSQAIYMTIVVLLNIIIRLICSYLLEKGYKLSFWILFDLWNT